jgi:hypothetical protein
MLALLDILISLAFIYGLFSVLVSAATELIMTVWSQRARTLWMAVRWLLPGDGSGAARDDVAASFLRHPLVQGMGAAEHDLPRKSKGMMGLFSNAMTQIKTTPVTQGKRAAFPSYLPSGLFVDTVMHMLKSGEIRKGTVHPDADMEALISDVENPALRTTLEALNQSSRDSGQPFRMRLERWYEDAMDRATGWYRRTAHVMLFLVAFIMAVVCNVDTVHIVTMLTVNPDLRKGLASKATEYVETQVDKIAKAAAAQPVTGDPNAQLQAKIEEYNVALKNLDGLGIPLHWGKAEKLYVALNPFMAIVGWLMSAVAATLGANFWFQILGGLVKMRLSGNKPVSTTPPRGFVQQGAYLPQMGQQPAGYAFEAPPPPAGFGLNAEPVDHEEGRQVV